MNSKNFNLLKTLKTIARWPRLFFTPLAIILAALIIYTSSIKIYRSSAIILFESSYIPVEEYFTLLDKFDSQPVTIVRSLLFGKTASDIVTTVWPEIKNDELAKNSKIQHLRSLSGVSLKFQRDNPQALSISYDSTDPKLSFKVVDATVKALIHFNTDLTKKRVDSAIEFITAELEKTRQEIANLEQQIIRVRSGLPAAILKDRDQESADIENILDLKNVDLDIESNLAKALKFDESLLELNSELEISLKELEQLQNDLEQKAYLNNLEDLQEALDAKTDPEMIRIANISFEKQQTLNELLAKGFLPAHPEVLAVKRELTKLKEMKKERLMSLQRASNRESPELTELKLEKIQIRKIEDKKMQIQALRDRIRATEAYEAKFKDRNITLDDKLQELSERKANLLELDNKRLVAAHSYAQMTKRLEVIKREGRIDQEKFGLSIKVAEKPEIPIKNLPFAGLPIILIGVTVSLVIIFSIASLMTLFDKSVYSSAELTAVLGLPVVGVIDRFISLEEQARAKRASKIAIAIFLFAVVLLLFYFNR